LYFLGDETIFETLFFRIDVPRLASFELAELLDVSFLETFFDNDFFVLFIRFPQPQPIISSLIVYFKLKILVSLIVADIIYC